MVGYRTPWREVIFLSTVMDQSLTHRRPPSCTGRSRRSLEQSQSRRPDMQIKDNRVFHSPALSKVRRSKMLSCSWTASRLECSVRLRKVGVSVMAVAASLRSGACRSPLVGSNDQVSGFFCRASPRSDTRGAVAAGGRLTDEDDSGRGAVRRPGHQKSSRGVRQRPALARVPEGFRPSKRPRRENAGGAHARRVAHPAAPRHCATVPGSRSTGLSQAAALQRWRARLTGHCVPTSQSAPRSPGT